MCYPTSEMCTSSEHSTFEVKVQHQVMKKRARCSVSFHHNVQLIGTVANLDSMRDEEWKAVWYEQSEIEHFRSEARYLSRNLREMPSIRDQVYVRGLELRASPARQQRKFLAVKLITRAQVRIVDPLRLAAVYSKCSEWSRDVAILEGQRDFFEVYNPERVQSVPELSISNAWPIPMKATPKRGRDSIREFSQRERNVRCKITASVVTPENNA